MKTVRWLDLTSVHLCLFSVFVLSPLSADGKDKIPQLPPEMFDMYDLKAPKIEADYPDGLPVVASTGTPTTGREVFIAAKESIDYEDTVVPEMAGTETLGSSQSDIQDFFAMTAVYNNLYDGCTDSSRFLCAYDDVYRFWYVDFIALSYTPTVEIVTSALQRWPGELNTPDTLLYLLRCLDDDCTTGAVIGIDDNGNLATPPGHGNFNGYDSKLNANLIADAHYRVILAAKYQGAEGTADLSVRFGTLTPITWTGLNFGGYHVRNKYIFPGDSIFVGKNSNSSTAGFPGAPNYHDSQMLFLTTMSVDCDTGACGSFFYNDDYRYGNSEMLLSKIDIPGGTSTYYGRVIIGIHDDENTLGNRYKMNARFFHYRRGSDRGGLWSSTSSYDIDGDGLSKEIEAALGTCDTLTDPSSDGVGIMGMSCYDFSQRIAGFGTTWNPLDSDNDGLGDGAEVFAVGVHCDNVPHPPYFDAGVCTKFGLHEARACPTGEYCVGTDLSAMSDPNPTMYDVYVFNDYVTTGATEFRISDGNSESTGGQDLLKRAWHDDSLSCWDGSAATWNGLTYECPGVEDLPYMINLHAYSVHGVGQPVTAHPFADAKFGYESPSGANWVHAFFNRFFKPEFKFTGIGLYSVSGPNGGGQAELDGRIFTWGSTWDDAAQELRAVDSLRNLSHEAAHCLGVPDIDTTQRIRLCAAVDTCSSVSDQELDDEDKMNCESELFCPEIVCPEIWSPPLVRTMRYAQAQNPVYPSLVNYGYSSFGAGLRQKNSQLPPQGGDPQQNCLPEYLRFSKGLFGEFLESSLVERNPVSRSDEKTWVDAMQVRDIECFSDHGRFKNAFDPYCDAQDCWIDWDAERFTTRNGPQYGPYSFDLTFGTLEHYPLGSPDCASDSLYDVNDLGTIQALGKRGPASALSYADFIIYKATFNAALNENLAGWDIPTTDTNLQFTKGVYPMNQCFDNSDCNGRTCKFDVCTTDSDCKSNTCGLDGICSCVYDMDCGSFKCLSGRCLTSRGTCYCSSDDDCLRDGLGSCLMTKHVCSNRNRTANSGYDRYQAPSYSAEFGNGGSSSMVLTNSGTQSPFVAIPDANTIEVKFDFFWNGMGSGQSAQRLLTTGNLNVTIYKTTTGGLLYASFPGKSVYVPIRTHQWYRVWAFSPKASSGSVHAVNLIVAPWDNYNGQYSADSDSTPNPDVLCMSSTRNSNFTNQGNVVLGMTSEGTYPFSGMIDNFHLRNFAVDDVRPKCP